MGSLSRESISGVSDQGGGSLDLDLYPGGLSRVLCLGSLCPGRVRSLSREGGLCPGICVSVQGTGSLSTGVFVQRHLCLGGL